MHILLVKTSSMGDVIHNLPVVTDIKLNYPAAQIDWVVEDAFSAIPRMHPHVHRVIAVAIRRWRKNILSSGVQKEFSDFKQSLRQYPYDFIIDTQGLLKSAVITRLARGLRCGMSYQSAREPLAGFFYNKKFTIPKDRHAVERNRMLASAALNYTLSNPATYGIVAQQNALAWLPSQPYAVFLHSTSRADKLWVEPNWISLAQYCKANGLICILPWGNSAERQRSERLSANMPDSVVPPALTLDEAAAMLAKANIVVGVDTGLTHLAAALQTRVISIYCASNPGLTGIYANPHGINLGHSGDAPATETVIQHMQRLLNEGTA